jgi:hypothetical protein
MGLIHEEGANAASENPRRVRRGRRGGGGRCFPPASVGGGGGGGTPPPRRGVAGQSPAEGVVKARRAETRGRLPPLTLGL